MSGVLVVLVLHDQLKIFEKKPSNPNEFILPFVIANVTNLKDCLSENENVPKIFCVLEK